MTIAAQRDFKLTRRDTLKWLGLVAASVGWPRSFASAAQVHWRDASHGYGRDPDLLVPPAQPWPLILAPEQRAIAAVVLDVILPGHAGAPPASRAGLVDFLDEWVSAPYPEQQADAARLVPLLHRMNDEAARRFGAGLTDASAPQRAELVAVVAGDMSPHRSAFQRLCVLAAAAYYTTPAGMTAIGFVGNEPRMSFDGPPAEVLRHFATALDALQANP